MPLRSTGCPFSRASRTVPNLCRRRAITGINQGTLGAWPETASSRTPSPRCCLVPLSLCIPINGMKAECCTFPILMSSRARSRSPARLALRAATLYSLCRANNRACGAGSATGRGAMAELPGRLGSGWKRCSTQNKRTQRTWLVGQRRKFQNQPHPKSCWSRNSWSNDREAGGVGRLWEPDRLSSDTLVHGTWSWGVCLRTPVGCFLVGWGPFAQGHWRWNLILTDRPAFPHSGKLGLQSLRERIILVAQVATWGLLEDKSVTQHVYHTCEWPFLYCHLTHSPAISTSASHTA